MDRGSWQAIVHGVTESQTRLSNRHFWHNEKVKKGGKERKTPYFFATPWRVFSRKSQSQIINFWTPRSKHKQSPLAPLLPTEPNVLLTKTGSVWGESASTMEPTYAAFTLVNTGPCESSFNSGFLYRWWLFTQCPPVDGVLQLPLNRLSSWRSTYPSRRDKSGHSSRSLWGLRQQEGQGHVPPLCYWSGLNKKKCSGGIYWMLPFENTAEENIRVTSIK